MLAARALPVRQERISLQPAQVRAIAAKQALTRPLQDQPPARAVRQAPVRTDKLLKRLALLVLAVTQRAPLAHRAAKNVEVGSSPDQLEQHLVSNLRQDRTFQVKVAVRILPASLEVIHRLLLRQVARCVR